MSDWITPFINTPLYQSLNEEQRKAVSLPYNENCLVVAGAGTGKTKTLVTRLCAVLQTETLKPSEVVAITFTTKAADEMKHRLRACFNKADEVRIGTFHSFALSLIKENPVAFGIKKEFTILSPEKTQSIIRSVLNKQFPEITFTKTNTATLAKHFDLLKDSPDFDYSNYQVTEEIKQEAKKATALLNYNNIKLFFTFFQAYLNENNLVDFQDLLLLVYLRLKKDKDYRQEIENRYALFFVDEFQDTNPLQFNLLKMLTRNSTTGAIFAVGDDAQSIYAFRGSQVGNLLLFKKEAKHFIQLDTNYRSTQNIVHSSNQLISHSFTPIIKNLTTPNKSGERISFNYYENQKVEAQAISRNIESLILTGIPANEIAVLYRNNDDAQQVEIALRQKKIAYSISGGISFFKQPEIALIIDIIKILVNHSIYGESFIQVLSKLNFFFRGRRPKILSDFSTLAKEADAEGKPFSLHFKEKYENQPFNQKIKEVIFDCQLKFEVASFEEALRFTLEKFHFNHWLKNQYYTNPLKPFAYKKNLSFSTQDEMKRIEQQYKDKLQNIDSFIQIMNDFEKTGGKYLANFLDHIEQSKSFNGNSSPISLMTIHSSKGLEFNYVFICSSNEKAYSSLQELKDFSHSTSAQTISEMDFLDQLHLLFHSRLELENEMDEERRLAYVALTRAKRKVWLSAYRSSLYLPPTENAKDKLINFSFAPLRYWLDIPISCIDVETNNIDLQSGYFNFKEDKAWLEKILFNFYGIALKEYFEKTKNLESSYNHRLYGFKYFIHSKVLLNYKLSVAEEFNFHSTVYQIVDSLFFAMKEYHFDFNERERFGKSFLKIKNDYENVPAEQKQAFVINKLKANINEILSARNA